jgi:ketosteroid isomerase-like protein
MATATARKPATNRNSDPIDIARASYEAYVTKDRATIEALIADDFHFTSPVDNRIDRKTYFERCWPASENAKHFEFIYLAQDGDRVFVTYEADFTAKKFRNTEILTIRDGKIVEAEVYFGWDMPHRAKPGEFVQKKPKAF